MDYPMSEHPEPPTARKDAVQAAYARILDAARYMSTPDLLDLADRELTGLGAFYGDDDEDETP
jgi:hypothetical protein